MPFLDREHFTPHFFSEKRQGTVTGAVATLLGTLLGTLYYCGSALGDAAYKAKKHESSAVQPASTNSRRPDSKRRNCLIQSRRGP